MYKCTSLIFVMAIAALSSAAVQRNNSTLSQTRDTYCNTNGELAISENSCCNNGQCCGNFLSGINLIQVQCAKVPVNLCSSENDGNGCGQGQVCSQLVNAPIIGAVAQAEVAGYICCSQYYNDDDNDMCRQYRCSKGSKRINEASTKWDSNTANICCNDYICNQGT